ncbi:putative Fe-S oxidoreductase [Sulfurovum sp. enrichment culture clone C5]|uniref:Putative Fe-S oxidoreductase n=1 Tax=Sulfurovum sp. enrichment culture clone C5 TaxID=497650 RepID=A0A0S4XLB2_9BACT|nr:putative Fe-S oxidoreductase [Sulfurovum sp. enrichment culture clone C5]
MYKQLPTFGRYLKRKFKTRVQKLPVGLSGFTCPNIDGTVAKGGCTFCLNESFSPNLAQNAKITLNLNSTTNPLLEQQLKELDRQIKQTQIAFRKQGVKKFLIYFQSFTNTYAPFSTLKALYEKALTYPDVIGLSIGTRSDSVSDEVYDYLADLSKTKEVWIEFGVQSIFDETLKKINRGHDALNAKEAILKAKAKGLNVCAHLIFGLPQESKDMMLQSAKEVYSWGIDSVKYHPLYVVKNTQLASEFKNNKFTPISKEEYAQTLKEAIKLKPEHITIQRITAGINDDSLLAPDWCGWGKNKMMDFLNKELNVV